MSKRKLPNYDTWLPDFRESAGLTPPPRTLTIAASRLVDLIDQYLYSIHGDWEIPPGYPRDRFVPSVYGKRELVDPIVRSLDALGFTGDASRLHEAARRFYMHRDWRLMTPSPGDDKGWEEFQQRYVNPLVYLAVSLQSVLREIRQLIIETGGKSSPPSGEKAPKSVTKDEAEAIARRLSKKDVTFIHLTAQEMSARIKQESGKHCSGTLVKGLPYWNEAMIASGRGRRRDDKGRGPAQGTSARSIRLTKEVEAVTGEGKEWEVLESLANAEEEANAERDMQQKMLAIAFVNRSRLGAEEKRQTIAKLEAGEMTPEQATEMVTVCKQDPLRNRKKQLSQD